MDHALKSVEVEEVWVGQFGRKVPLDQWEQEFGHVLSLPMSPSIAFDMGWYEDKCSIYLFGISGGRGEVQIGRCALKAYIHPILSGFSQPDENRVWNTLELRFADKVPRGLNQKLPKVWFGNKLAFACLVLYVAAKAEVFGWLETPRRS